jgi:hypothetical protein
VTVLGPRTRAVLSAKKFRMMSAERRAQVRSNAQTGPDAALGRNCFISQGFLVGAGLPVQPPAGENPLSDSRIREIWDTEMWQKRDLDVWTRLAASQRVEMQKAVHSSPALSRRQWSYAEVN